VALVLAGRRAWLQFKRFQFRFSWAGFERYQFVQLGH